MPGVRWRLPGSRDGPGGAGSGGSTGQVGQVSQVGTTGRRWRLCRRLRSPAFRAPVTSSRRCRRCTKIAEHMVIEPADLGSRASRCSRSTSPRSLRLPRSAKGPSSSAPAAKLTFMSFITKAVVDALREVPIVKRVRGWRQRRSITRTINVGIAVRARLGPDRAGHQAGRREEPRRTEPVHHRSGRAGRAIEEAQARRSLRAAPSRSPTRACSGALFGTPIINQPQVAILGVGNDREARRGDRRAPSRSGRWPT